MAVLSRRGFFLLVTGTRDSIRSEPYISHLSSSNERPPRLLAFRSHSSSESLLLRTRTLEEKEPAGPDDSPAFHLHIGA